MLRPLLKFVFRPPAPTEVTASSQLSTLFLIAGVIGFFVWWYGSVDSSRWGLLNQLLQLPPGVARSSFTPSSTDKSFEELRRGTAEVTFSEEQLQDFIRLIDGRTARAVGPNNINRVPVKFYSARALAWTPPPLPKRIGDRMLETSGLLPDAGASAETRVLCLVFQDPRAWNDPSPKLVYWARNCAELSAKDNPTIVVLAVLDVSTRKMRIRVE